MDSLLWYALRVRPRYEKATASLLAQKGYEGFLPLYSHRSRWSDRIKEVQLPLFPGYMFCRFDVSRRLPILITPGVIEVVSLARTPYPVDEKEITALQSLIISNLQVEPRSYLNIGTRVRIELGPLSGVEGILTGRKGSHRLVVSVSLLQRSVAVEINESWAIPVTPMLPKDRREINNAPPANGLTEIP